MEPYIKVDNVTMRYSPPTGGSLEVISHVDFSIEKGSFITLIGPSGCGKSTLLNIMSGMVKPTEGRIMLDGKEILKPEPNKLAMVFQEASLYPWKTVIKNVEFGLELRKVPKDQRRQAALKYLELVGLESFNDYYPSQISGGMQQRVSVARALALEPEVLLMDEPFGALDEQTRLIMGRDLVRIWSETKKTIVFVTHSLVEAAFLSDQIVVMSARPGRINEVIEVKVERPRDPETPELADIRRRLWTDISKEADRQLLARG